MATDPLRHLSVFTPHAFGNRRIDVIGAGATGSRVVLELSKLGVENLHVWDFDTVEEHNIANQVFGNQHIGQFKVDALAEIVKRDTGNVIHVHNEKHTGDRTQPLGDVVFLLTDTMESRKQIWDGALKFRPHTSLVIETRMGADDGRIYTINPSKPNHIKEWEATLYDDDEAEVSACGGSVSVGPTAEILAGIAKWQLIRWFAIEQGHEDELEHEIIFSLRPMVTLTRRF